MILLHECHTVLTQWLKDMSLFNACGGLLNVVTLREEDEHATRDNGVLLWDGSTCL